VGRAVAPAAGPALDAVEHALGVTRAFSRLRGAEWARVRGWSEWDGYERAGSGLYVPAAVKLSRYPTGIDLFAGAGGFSLGFHQAGIHVVAALEWDVDAAMTYLINMGDPCTRIYAPDAERKAALLTRNDAERKRAGKLRNPKYASGRGGWMDAATGETLTQEPHPLEHAPMVDHGDYLTWPSAGSAWLTSSRRRRSDELPNPPDYGSDYVRELNTVDPTACLEPCRVFFLADARRLSGRDILDVLGVLPGTMDVVCGGPPCQGFSTSGRRNVYDPRNSLVFDFVRLVCDIQPRTWCMENVPAMASMVTTDGELVVDAIGRMAEQGGMGAADNIRQMLEATAGVGVAQRHVRRHGDVKNADGETRAERRRRLRDERKAAKREAKTTVAAGADGATYLQDELFVEAPR
jgi:site-specific DNA-cytosine methylase